jgi:hypothetical protein
MFHAAFRGSRKRIEFSNFGSVDFYWFCRVALRPKTCAQRYNNILLNCFPGNCRTNPFISRSNSVAKTSEEFNPVRSTMSSIGRGSSELNSA